LTAANRAQEQALALYPASQARLRTQVRLHRASCLIQSGHVSDGLRHAADLLDALPADQHNEPLHEVARQVVAVVPSGTARSDVAELEARIPTIRT
jgi:thioredoxin-like negative regulator of GroEL